jgi:tetratricopeptide (TPR) repeat protein
MDMNTTTMERFAPSPQSSIRRRRARRTAISFGGLVLGIAMLAAGAVGFRRDEPPAPAASPMVDPRLGGLTARIGAGSIAETVTQLEARVEAFPNDDVALATLAIAYVEQARITGDPTRYRLADEVLGSSLDANDDDNYLAYAGLAAVAAARHDFPTAERHALSGLEINPANATLWGVLSDVQIQLGKYDDGFASVERMGDLVPDIASITRAAYVAELTGDSEEARRLMQRALEESFTGDDRAFALFQLGELKLGEGEPNEALGYFLDALTASPNDISALSGKAHALGQAGQIQTAAANYELLLDRAPLADFMIEYGEFLDGHGEVDEAEVWYDRARAQIEIDRANGVQPDAALIFFEVDHGDPGQALVMAEAAVEDRPFFELQEALAWALYRNNRFADAAEAVERAGALGIQDPELHIRAALIQHALGDAEAAHAHLETAMQINPFGIPYLTDDDSRTLDQLLADRNLGVVRVE